MVFCSIWGCHSWKWDGEKWFLSTESTDKPENKGPFVDYEVCPKHPAEKFNTAGKGRL